MTNSQWDESYSVGIASLDAQHEGIMATAERLRAALRMGRAVRIQQQILREIAEYAAAHCEREERVMATAGFPGLDMHRRKHREILESLRGYVAFTESHELPVDAAEFVCGRIRDHVREQDSQYAKWIKRKNVVAMVRPQPREANAWRS